MRLVDTHCHVGFRAYADDAADVIKRAQTDDIVMVTIGTQQDTSRAAAELANKHDFVYASIGLHPTHSIAHGFKLRVGESKLAVLLFANHFKNNFFPALFGFDFNDGENIF